MAIYMKKKWIFLILTLLLINVTYANFVENIKEKREKAIEKIEKEQKDLEEKREELKKEEEKKKKENNDRKHPYDFFGSKKPKNPSPKSEKK